MRPPPDDVAVPAVSPRRSRPAKGLTHDIVDALSAEMDRGSLKPGDKLPTESEIMAAFGVSRGVVREALSRLQAAGRVQTHHGVGTFALAVPTGHRFHVDVRHDGGDVDHATLQDMLDLLELRTSVESDAAGLAATRRTPAHLHDMQVALADFARHDGVVGDSVAPDFRFHVAIAQATGNRHVGDLVGQLGLAVIPKSRVSSSRLAPEHRARHLEKVDQEHRDIFAAIERRDAEGARAAMRIHLVNSRERQRVAHAEALDTATTTATTAIADRQP